MCNLIEINVEDREKWNETVRSFEDYEVFYLNEYVSAFKNESRKNGEPILLYYERDMDRAINVVFKRDIAEDELFEGKIEKNAYFDLISPYGYGGFWGVVEDYAALQNSYNQYCIDNNYICEFVRFELFSEYNKHYDGEVESRTHNVVRSLTMPMEELWMDFKQKVRKNVKRANSLNLQVIFDNTGEYLQEFLKIYYGTMERNDADKQFYFSKEFFMEINKMKDNIMYVHVALPNEEGKVKIISTELVLYGAKNGYSYLGGTSRDYFEYRPNDLLKYEIIKWAKEKGLENFVLGGGYGGDDGIFQYKTALAPNGIVDFYIGRKIFDKELYNRFCQIRGIEQSSFFPAYRSK